MCSELRDTTARKHYYFFPENFIFKLPKNITMPINHFKSVQVLPIIGVNQMVRHDTIWYLPISQKYSTIRFESIQEYIDQYINNIKIF